LEKNLLSSVEDIKKRRFEYLYEVYKLTQSTNEFTTNCVNKYSAGERLNLSRNTVDRIVDYFITEGLVRDFRWQSRSGGYGEGSYIELTNAGIKEVEQQVEKPDSSTEHFPPYSVFNISGGNFTNSQFQVANKDSSQNITVINQNQSTELKEIVTELKQILSNSDIPGEKKQELEAEVQTIESQSKSPKPKIQIIKDALASAKGIIEDVSGVAATAAPLAIRIASWLDGVP
jgi:hypothetical protein